METGCGPRFNAYSSAERKGVPEKEKKLEAEIAELYAKAGRSPSPSCKLSSSKRQLAALLVHTRPKTVPHILRLVLHMKPCHVDASKLGSQSEPAEL